MIAFDRISTMFAALLFCALMFVVADSHAAEEPQRLSKWLASRVIAADDYPLGLVWVVPGEKAAQAQLRSRLLKSVEEDVKNAEAKQRLQGWLAGLPVTGRVPISIADADWLSANPQHDPVILPGQEVILPKRPHTITLVTSQGIHCQLPHLPGRYARQYLEACVADNVGRFDWGWVVQPDGKVYRLGIASWNAQQQVEPAPGAWIWVPSREDVWAFELSGKLAEFLATQGVAADSGYAVSDSMAQVGAGGEYWRDPVVTANDWGAAGLLQSPTARMRVTGHGSMTLSRTIPYSHTNFFLQPMEWLELGFRYTSVSNRLYGPAIAGDQSYKDKSIDVKLGLLDESAYLPQVALGLRDITGTGLFSGEYLVANKRTGAFDWSIGLGWGYIGGRSDLANPLATLSPKFEVRKKDVGQGGNFALSSYFRGPTALFGGVQYQSPWEPLILKLEYDGNDYQHEPQSNNQRQDSVWNMGAVYRAGPALEISLGFERGNTLTLGITLQTDLSKMAMPKLDDPAALPLAVQPPHSLIGAKTAADLERQTGWAVSRIEQQGSRMRVDIADADAVYWRDRFDRANAVLHRDAPAAVSEFDYVHHQHGVGVVEHHVDRSAWLARQTQPLPPGEQQELIVTQPVAVQTGNEVSQPEYLGARPRFAAEPAVGLRYNLGGPDGFILYQMFAEGRAKLHLRDDTWLQGSLQLGLLDNYDKFKYTAPSNLPRVRTYLREYLTESSITMPNLQLTHMGKLSGNQYFSVYGGFLENMYAGFGAEWMYRTQGSPLALGVDVNRVRQRDFRQDFALRDYQIETGHATLYWNTGWNDVLANLSAGRYLAGDAGVTVEMSRVFRNGVRFGGYFTKTNVSSVQFGEGSFDKGLYVLIPFDAMLTKSSSKVGNFIWKPLIRDGGAKLGREVQLYEMTKLLDERTLQIRPAELENTIAVPSQRQPGWGAP